MADRLDNVEPGFRFKEGKLYLFFTDEIMVIHGWPELRAVRKPKGRPWQEFDPTSRLIGPYRRQRPLPPDKGQPDLGLRVTPAHGRVDMSLKAQRKRAFDAFRFSFPRPVAARVENFLSHQWAVLKLFREQPLAVELCRVNPALVFCLAHLNHFTGPPANHPEVVGAALVLKKQRDVLARLGFPATEATVRLLAKIRQESVSLHNMPRLPSLLAASDFAERVAHLRKLNAGVIELLADPATRDRATPSLLMEVSGRLAEKYRADTHNLMREMDEMGRQMGRELPLRAFTSRRQMLRHHEAISEDFRRVGHFAAHAGLFPRPPIPESSSIVALRTPASLVEEGREQCNCVATYAPQVSEHTIYIYRVLAPQRATLSLVKNAAGHWELDQLKLKHNRPASSATRAAVEAWLLPHRHGV